MKRPLTSVEIRSLETETRLRHASDGAILWLLTLWQLHTITLETNEKEEET